MTGQPQGEKLPVEEYLGDGVYVVWDGMNIWLDCRAQPSLSIGPTGHPGICLDVHVDAALEKFRARVGA